MLPSKAVILQSAVVARAAPVAFAACNLLAIRLAQSGATSYDDLKAVANKTGDPAREWHAGATADGAGVTQKLHRPAEVIVESVKRGAEEVTEVAKEACEARAMKSLRKAPAPSPPKGSSKED